MFKSFMQLNVIIYKININLKLKTMKTNLSTLNLGLIHKMIACYRNNQLKEINNSVPNDAESIWFDLETLKSFIEQIESNAKNNNTSSRDIGIRFYYASYPEKKELKNYKDLKNIPESYSKLHTLIAVPTIHRNGVHHDFDPMNPLTYTKKLTDIEYFKNPKTKITGIHAEGNSITENKSITAKNHGSLIPPFSNEGISF